MARQCALLAASLPPVGTALEREQRLHAAILRALEALDDDQR